MLIQVKRKLRPLDSPQMHENHKRPVTRRDFIAQGFLAGGAALLGGGVMSLFANPRQAFATLAQDLTPLTSACGISNGAGKIPFICFDLAGGANLTGSEMLCGQSGRAVRACRPVTPARPAGHDDPGVAETTALPGSNGDHTNTQLGLAFHADSAICAAWVADERGVDGERTARSFPRARKTTSNNPQPALRPSRRARTARSSRSAARRTPSRAATRWRRS
jgi:hypothetical protein